MSASEGISSYSCVSEPGLSQSSETTSTFFAKSSVHFSAFILFYSLAFNTYDYYTLTNPLSSMSHTLAPTIPLPPPQCPWELSLLMFML